MSEAQSIFSPTSGASTQGPILPKNLLAWVGITVQELKQSQETGGTYAAIELTVLAPDEYKTRKLWEMICDPFDGRNKEGWRQMAVSAMTRIFEAAGIFDPANPDSYNQFNGWNFSQICTKLNGAVAAVKVGIDPGKDGYSDKNRVGDWLSPNPNSGGHKDFIKLTNPQQATEAARTGFLQSAQQTGVAHTAPVAVAPIPVNIPAAAAAVAGAAPATPVAPPVAAPAPGALPPPAGFAAPSAPPAGFQRPGAPGAGTATPTAAPAWLQPAAQPPAQ